MNCPNCKGVLDPACGLCNGRGTVILICNNCGKAEPHCKCYPLQCKSTGERIDGVNAAKALLKADEKRVCQNCPPEKNCMKWNGCSCECHKT